MVWRDHARVLKMLAIKQTVFGGNPATGTRLKQKEGGGEQIQLRFHAYTWPRTTLILVIGCDLSQLFGDVTLLE